MDKLAMHQPNWLPWIGFFHKMDQADVFVLMDDTQVPQGRSFASRTRIKIPTGERSAWLTVPLKRDGLRTYNGQSLLPVGQWMGRVWGGIYHNYKSAPYWNYGGFESEFTKATNLCHSLAGLNIWMINWAREVLGIETQLVNQSSTGVHVNKYELPARLCKALDCGAYLSGNGARKYNDRAAFDIYKVKLEYQEYEPAEYPQLWGEFVPNLSIIDLIFNCGPDAGKVLRCSSPS